MKLQCVSLWLLGTILMLCSVDNHGLRRCLISTDMDHIEDSFQEIKRAIVSMGWCKGVGDGVYLPLHLSLKMSSFSLPFASQKNIGY